MASIATPHRRRPLNDTGSTLNSRSSRASSNYLRPSVQIYNEQVRDLFGHGGSGHGLRVREHPTKGAFVEGLSARPVVSYQQVQRLLEDGMSAR